MNIEVYADGSATVSTKPGGYGWVMIIDGVKHSEGYGHMENASNNDAEMEAAIQGLVAVFKHLNSIKQMLTAAGSEQEQTDRLSHAEVTLVSDSQIVLGWASGRYRFKQEAKIQKFKMLKELVTRLDAKTRWVEGHSGDEHNERCDKLANLGRKGGELKPQKTVNKRNKSIANKEIGVVCLWYKGVLKVIDLETNAVENYDETSHGPRSSRFALE